MKRVTHLDYFPNDIMFIMFISIKSSIYLFILNLKLLPKTYSEPSFLLWLYIFFWLQRGCSLKTKLQHSDFLAISLEMHFYVFCYFIHYNGQRNSLWVCIDFRRYTMTPLFAWRDINVCVHIICICIHTSIYVCIYMHIHVCIKV